jgi:hypothetical protein
MTGILISRGGAFSEYVLQSPANRIGHGRISAAELKSIQAVIPLRVRGGLSEKAADLGPCRRTWLHRSRRLLLPPRGLTAPHSYLCDPAIYNRAREA